MGASGGERGMMEELSTVHPAILFSAAVGVVAICQFVVRSRGCVCHRGFPASRGGARCPPLRCAGAGRESGAR